VLDVEIIFYNFTLMEYWEVRVRDFKTVLVMCNVRNLRYYCLLHVQLFEEL